MKRLSSYATSSEVLKTGNRRNSDTAGNENLIKVEVHNCTKLEKKEENLITNCPTYLTHPLTAQHHGSYFICTGHNLFFCFFVDLFVICHDFFDKNLGGASASAATTPNTS